MRTALNVFSRRDGQIRHAYCTELLLAAADPEMSPGMADDLTSVESVRFAPQGRGRRLASHLVACERV